MDRDSLERLQKKRLEKILRCASETHYYSPFLQDVPVSDAVEDLSLLPVSERSALRLNPLSLVRRSADKASLKRFKTSGTSGIPMTIYTDQEEAWQRMAIAFASEISQGRTPFDLFAEISRDPSPPHPVVSYTGLFRKIKLDPHEAEAGIYEKLAGCRPSMIKAYLSIFTTLARLNEKRLKPKALISCGETVSQTVRKLIEDSFSCPLLDYYGAWEFRAVGWECPEERRMHINSSSLKVEIVDAKGKPAKGKGEIAVTSLYNRTMPLVRYNLGDRGRWGKDCPCGRGYPVLDSLEGKEAVLIRLPSGRIHPGAYLGLLFADSMYREVQQYQVVQEREDLFVFRYSGSELSEKTKAELYASIKNACLGEDITLEFEQVGRIPRGKTGKIQRVVSRLNLADGL